MQQAAGLFLIHGGRDCYPEISLVHFRSTILVFLLVSLAACSSTASLNYTPTVPIVAGPPGSVSAVVPTDMRDEKPNRLATVRGGFGNPFYVRDTTRPVADEVASVFTAGLQARGMLSTSANAPYRIQLVLRTFDANKYISRNTSIDIDLIVIDRSGHAVYRDTVHDKRESFQLFDADIDALQKLAQDLLDATVDRMLDNPKLRAALGNKPAAGPPTT